jgi:peroxiredoxin Q/BCP
MSKTALAVAALILVVVAGLAIRSFAADSGTLPQAGQTAPTFTLPNQTGTPVSLDSYKGKWVVLYFYPKDMTTGCTIEAHNFQRDLAKYEAKDAVILGISVQDEKSHQQFCTTESLTFKLLADTDKKVSQEYDSIMNLAVTKLSARHTYLIGPDGKVRKVWTDVDVKKHSDDVLAAIDELQKS